MFGESVQVSVVTTVRDKTQFVKSAGSVLSQLGVESYEYVVVDWGSEKQKVLKELKRIKYNNSNVKSIRYLRVNNPTFHRGIANNVGFRWCTGKYILTLDCDVVIDPNYLNELLTIIKRVKRGCLWCLGIESNNNKIRPWCGSGIMFVPMKAVYYIRGYDESFVGYGEEDIDFRKRLEMSGYVVSKIESPFWTHLSHTNKERGQAQRCSRVHGGANVNRNKRLVNEKHGVVRVNDDDWGMVNGAVKHVELC